MTLLVGIYCSDGVVIAADSEATFAAGQMPTIGKQMVDKLFPICDGAAIWAGTGAVGMGQVFVDGLNRAWASKKFNGCQTAPELMNRIGTEIGHLCSPHLISAQPLQHLGQSPGTSLCKSLIAYSHKNKHHLFSFDVNGAPEMATQQLPFVSMGSGQSMADPFLAFLRRVLWQTTTPTLAEGRLVAIWTINHVSNNIPGGIGGPTQIWTLKAAVPHIAKLEAAEIQEHLQKIAAAEKALVDELRGDVLAAAPPMPIPPA